jgi:hypothetical protein
VAPNPSTEVNVYDPGAGTWSIGPAFVTARRNSAAEIDPASGRIFMAGGYAPTSATNDMEIYTPAVPCSTPTSTPPPPTPTATPLPPTATATSAPVQYELYLPAAFYNAIAP